jgi:hypothetical protein
MTFIVRMTVADDGTVNGVVERPRTGEKQRFQDTEALGRLIAVMAREEAQARQQ